jgi:hypothetical protein
MFQLVVDLILVGGILWLFLTGIFWIKGKISPAPTSPAPEVVPDPMSSVENYEPEQPSGKPAKRADTK